MRLFSLVLPVLLAAPAVAQCYQSPDNMPGSGSCNTIPFGDHGPSSTRWPNHLFQMLVTAADLNNQVGVITGLAFAPCGSGTRQFKRLTIRLGHNKQGVMSTTFANNFSTPAQTVLDVRDFHWPNVGNTWTTIPLEHAFTYVPALGDLQIEILTQGAVMPGAQPSASMHTGARPRLWNRTWTGTPPTTGSLGLSSGLKVQVCLQVAGTAIFGLGCTGSNQQVPTLSYTGTGQINQVLSIDVGNAAGTIPYIMIFGATVAPPFPVVLDGIGMVGCRLYHNIAFTLAGATVSGSGSTRLPIPNNPTLVGFMLFNQAALFDKQGNALGLVLTNAGQVSIGN